MPADTSVKFFHSGMAGAPTLTGQVGTRIAVLDACLVNGFGAGTVDSVVIASGVGTVTKSTGHPFEVDTVAEISGATVSGGTINGQHKVLSVTANTWTFDATGIADQTATGTISAKLAAAGWTKPFSGTNLAAYQSADVAATDCILRVDDTAAQIPRVVGYEAMTDINTGTGLFSGVTGGQYWPGSNAASSATRPWFLVADGRAFYLCVASSNTTAYTTVFFGDVLPTKSPDNYACLLVGFSVDVNGTPGANLNDTTHGTVTSPTSSRMPRTYLGVGSEIEIARVTPPPRGTSLSYSGSSTGAMPFPNPEDGGLYVSKVNLIESSNTSLRGHLPGMYHSLQNIGTAIFANRDKISGVSGLTGRKLMAMLNSSGPAFFDITGPWR